MSIKIEWGKVSLLALAVLIGQGVLTYLLYPIIGKTTQTVFAIGSNISPVSGVGGTQLGDTILGYVSGYIPFSITNFAVWIAMYIGAFALVLAGMLLYTQKVLPLWQGKNLTQRLFAILLYGHIVLYLALLALKWSVPGIALNLLVGFSVNLLLLATLVTLSADKLKFPRI